MVNWEGFLLKRVRFSKKHILAQNNKPETKQEYNNTDRAAFYIFN